MNKYRGLDAYLQSVLKHIEDKDKDYVEGGSDYYYSYWLQEAIHFNNMKAASNLLDCLSVPTDLDIKDRLVYFKLFGTVGRKS